MSGEPARFHILRYPPPLPPSRSSFLRPLSARKGDDAARRSFNDDELVAYRDTKDFQRPGNRSRSTWVAKFFVFVFPRIHPSFLRFFFSFLVLER